MEIVEQVEQVSEIVTQAHAEGLVLLRTMPSIQEALDCADGYAHIVGERVGAYAECSEDDDYHIIRTVVVSKGLGKSGLGSIVMQNRLDKCFERNPHKEVVLTCAAQLHDFYARFGFHEEPKELAPASIRGGRNEAKWQSCDRIWMTCRYSDYLKKRKTMAKPNAFVKMSGSLLSNSRVIEWLAELSANHFVAICIGGGDQINAAFNEEGLENRFGPLGRITKTHHERQLARDILEVNQALIQDLLDYNQVAARAIIPVEEIGGVLCHINGDVMLLATYNGYDKLFLLTTLERVAKKEAWVKQLASVFQSSAEGVLDKIEVIGF